MMPNILQQAMGSALALEHALVMLLLLVGLLSIRGSARHYVPWVVLAGVTLSLFTPTHTLDFPWPVLSALVLPPLLWQIAVRMATARPALRIRDWLVWLLTALLIGLALFVGGRQALTGALLLGILAASLVWQVHEQATGSTDLGAFGQLALALLLAEIDVALHSLGPLMGSLFAGAALGLLLGYLSVRIAFRLPEGEARNLFCQGMAYAAYLFGALMGGSGVVTAAMTGLMIAVYGHSAGLWPAPTDVPMPLSRTGMFVLMAAAFLLLGWQADIPITWFHILGVGLSVGMVAIGVLLERWLEGRKVVLLLVGTLLLWPQDAILEPRPLAIALVAALVALAILRVMLYPAFSLLGIEMRKVPESKGQDMGCFERGKRQ